MADIWSSVGNTLEPSEGAWLYRAGGHLHGPVSFARLRDKLFAGEVDGHTEVALQGGTYHPLGHVAEFVPHLAEAQRRAAARQARRSRRRGVGVLTALLVVALMGAVVARQEYTTRLRRRLQRVAAQQQEVAAAEQQAAAQALARAAAQQQAHHMGLVALVSLGTQSDVNIAPARRRRAGHKVATQEVEGCALSQTTIFTTLRAELSKINVCVEDEKRRDSAGLLPARLPLGFVVRPSGRVTDFSIDDRHFRTGPLNNCLTKAFGTIVFPSSSGANCPVTIPIKIGK